LLLENKVHFSALKLTWRAITNPIGFQLIEGHVKYRTKEYNYKQCIKVVLKARPTSAVWLLFEITSQSKMHMATIIRVCCPIHVFCPYAYGVWYTQTARMPMHVWGMLIQDAHMRMGICIPYAYEVYKISL